MAQLKQQTAYKIKAFGLIESLVALSIIMLVFVGASAVFLKFSMQDVWIKRLKAQACIETNYTNLKSQENITDLDRVFPCEELQVACKINVVAEHLYLIEYKVNHKERLVLHQSYYLLK